MIEKALKMTLFFVLAPLYIPLAVFMNLTFDWWQDLL